MKPTIDQIDEAITEEKAWNTRAQPKPIDVEALKREVCETVTHNIQKVGAVYAVNVVSDIIDHLAAHYNITKKGE